MRVSQQGVIQYRNPASVSLCRLWNPADEGMLPPTVCEMVKAAYARTEIIHQEMAFGERTYLVTVAPPPPPEKYINIFARDITLRKQAEKRLHELNATLEDRVTDRTAELEYRARQLRKMTLELSETEERERQRMAEILHDDLQQILAAAKFHLSLMRNRVKHDASLQAIGSEIDEMLKEAIEKSRSLSHELSPAVLHHGDFHEALNWLAHQIKAKHGLCVHVHVRGNVNLQSDTLTALVYRTIQELLFNVVKHARTTEATIEARRHGRWVGLAVSDRGRGFDPQELRTAPGYGLLSIRERIELLGGRVRIKSAKGKGSTVFVIVPDRQTLGAPSEVETRETGWFVKVT